MDTFNHPQHMWGLQELQDEIRLLKASQFEHAERLTQHSERLNRLERQDGSGIRSLWGTPSPFPPMLSSFAQQTNNPEPPEDFSGFEEHQHNLLAGLQLDEVDVPRRGASRANSVRFDDSAIQNHWIHDSQTSNDYFGHRNSGSSLEGFPMTERSSSHKSDHKSDGRQSSMRSYGDNSSFFEGEINGGVPFNPPLQNLELLDCETHRSLAPPSGPAPAIIRCWPDLTSSSTSFLYAVVCTGSVKSLIDISLIARFGLQDQINKDTNGEYKINLSLHLPDATIQQPARGGGQHSLPPLNIRFSVMPNRKGDCGEGDEVGIFLGSDFMSDHMGDVLFSQSQLLLQVDDGRKMFVPFHRPEAHACYSDVCTTHAGDQLSGDLLGPLLQTEGRQEQGTTFMKRGRLHEPNASGMAIDDLQRSYVPVSSPKPVRGRKASVISRTTMTSPESSLEPDDTPGKYTGVRRNSIYSVGSGMEKKRKEDRKGEYGVRLDLADDVGTSSNEEEDGKGAYYVERRTRSDGEGGSSWNSSAVKSGEAAAVNTKEGGPVWDSWRKVTIQGRDDSGTGTAKTSRASSRGMKVLRTSKSSSLSEARANHQTEGGSGGNCSAEPDNASSTIGPVPRPPGGGFPKTDSSLSAGAGGNWDKVISRPQRRVSSAEAGNSFPKGGAIHPPKAKSTNVVGGASAFHWMTPKTSAQTTTE
ncbi:hypothetical protein C7212DRAFT_350395 [Tuber magnatum]|uniref:Ubiquitin carboxyl-terminal hydrolase 19 n=1 Tax=Tuber magnatum TaxID=42249 RepID=A0A317T1B8_9PEZI|nr:hypothetical protein C7212DRAFT_350395 [Tuber magnatum]